MNNLSGLAKPMAWRFGVWSAGITFGLSNLAWAQDDDSDQSAQVAQPDMWETYGERILILLAAGAVGFGIGAFFSPMAKPFRKFIWLGALALGLLYSLFGPSPNADILNGGVAFIVFCIALVLGLRLGLKLREHVASKRARPTSFGSAKWATFDYLAEHGLFSGGGFVLGEFLNGQQPPTLRYDGARHMLTIALTRSGKGVSSIIPNLLLHGGSARGPP